MNRLAARDLSILGDRERALTHQQIAPGERVRFCLVGQKGHALIALDDRVVVIKAGFGAAAASFEYAAIDAIEVKTGRTRGTIEIQTAVLGTTKADDFWATNDTADRFNLPNSLPIVTSDLEVYAPYVAELRGLISDAKQKTASMTDAQEQAWNDLVGQLQKPSCCLHRDGIRCDTELADTDIAFLRA